MTQRNAKRSMIAAATIGLIGFAALGSHVGIATAQPFPVGPPASPGPFTPGPLAPPLPAARVVNICGCSVNGLAIRVLGASKSASNDFAVNIQPLNTAVFADQRWLMIPVGNNFFRLMQMSSGRFLDSRTEQEPFRAVTRFYEQSRTQLWILEGPPGAFSDPTSVPANERFFIRRAGTNRHLTCDGVSPLVKVQPLGQPAGTQEWQIAAAGLASQSCASSR